MDILRVRLFGRVQLSHNNWKTEVNVTRVIQGLLAYLLLQRHRTHTRDGLANLFWAEQSQEKARGCLNTTLWRLRTILEPSGVPQGTYLISNHIGDVGFSQQSRYWLDVEMFENEVKNILTKPYHLIEKTEIEKLRKIIELYRGDLLEGFYDDWALRERERFRSLYLNSLVYLMRYEQGHGLYENGLVYGRKVLELDPLREEIHREMMRLYVDNQQRALAVLQYKACCEILRNELHIDPMAETQNLYAQIMSSEPAQPSDPSKMELKNLTEILQDLRLAARSMEQMQGHLTRVIGSVEAFFEGRSKLPPIH